MSTLEAVREMLCQATEAPPGEVLKSAQEEVARLSHLVQNAKNVLQRNGARKKLTELEPLIPALEIEVSLVELEKSGDQVKSAAQRAATRVQAQKLAAQITALPECEEKELFRQWLADLNPSLASASPNTTPPVSSVTVPAFPPPTPLPPPLPLPAPDPAEEIQATLASLEFRAAARPVVDPPGLVQELKALAQQTAALPSSETRTRVEARISSIITALKSEEDLRGLSEAVGALEQTVLRVDADPSSVLAEHDQIAARIARLGAGPELDALKQKLSEMKTALSAREESAEIERALQRWADRIQKDPADPMIPSGLSALDEKINRLGEANARMAFSQRLDFLRKLLIQRGQEQQVSTALEEVERKCRMPQASADLLNPILIDLTNQVQALPENQAKSDFQKRLRECGGLISGLAQKPPQKIEPAVVLQLDPIRNRSAPAARPLIFVARDRFSIGRKPENEPARADLLTPSAELRISRVHVTFFARQRQIHVLAGEEGKPSTNPALIDETPLTGTPVTINFDDERRVDLTGVYTLRAKLIPSATPFGPPFDENEPNGHAINNTTVLVPPITGALRVRPQGEDRLPVAAVWLFTDATIGTNPNCAVTLPQSGIAPEQVRIHFWRKSFWIEVLRSGGLVQLAGKTLQPGASQPFLSGQELRIGNFIYKVLLSS